MNWSETLSTAGGELVLAGGALALLLLGVFRGDGATRMVSWLVVGLFTVAGVITLVNAPAGPSTSFNGLFILDPFAVFMKTLTLIGAAVSLIASQTFIHREGMARFEYPLLFLFSVIGMMLMISANDLMTLYVGLELQSLSLYVIAAFRRDTLRSTEAGLKYFVLGALSSGLLLYGASLVYGFAGSTNFDAIATAAQGGETNLGLVIGIVFVAAGLSFKVSAFPFHMWTPDVYEGAPTPVTAFFAVAPKIAAMALFIRVLMDPFGPLISEWQQIIVLVSVGSMTLGALAALNQSNIKRLMAYSSIGHIGYALVGLAAGSEAGVRGVLIYMAIYLAMNAGVFACILSMRSGGRALEQVEDLKGASTTHPMMAATLAVLLFAMAGIPPLAGFFGKLYVFLAAVEAELYALAIIGVLTSVISAFYYIRMIKFMYFDEPVEPMDHPIGRDMAAIMTVTGGFTLLYILSPAALTNAAAWAAQSFSFAG